MKDILGKSATNAAESGNKRNGEPPTDNDERLKECTTCFRVLLNVVRILHPRHLHR